MGRNRYSPQEQAFYRKYLNSPAWRAKKDARIAKAGGQCEYVHDEGASYRRRCPRRRYLCAHHNTYERLGKERDTDIDVICWAHHMIVHLLQKACKSCGSPCLGHDGLAELWMDATMAQLGIDLDHGPVKWIGLPTKEQLADTIPEYCPTCNRYSGGKP